ncbi:MAG: hypothetical protein LLF78_04275 [Synergistaceae bacterium]|nr:hypothetical protein [Synergistaceae bacterium]
MNKLIISATLVLTGLLLAGCAAGQLNTHNHDSQVSRDTFVEAIAEAVPAGFGYLVIQTSIKTHPEGFYPMESSASHHGADHYPFVVTVGQQSVTWSVEGAQADTPKYAPDGSTPKDPEAGPGMRYSLDKRLRLKPGIYDVRIELPDDNAISVAKVTIREGRTAVVEFKPLYKMKNLPFRMPSYLKGVSSLEVYIDGKKQ